MFGNYFGKFLEINICFVICWYVINYGKDARYLAGLYYQPQIWLCSFMWLIPCSKRLVDKNTQCGSKFAILHNR